MNAIPSPLFELAIPSTSALVWGKALTITRTARSVDPRTDIQIADGMRKVQSTQFRSTGTLRSRRTASSSEALSSPGDNPDKLYTRTLSWRAVVSPDAKSIGSFAAGTSGAAKHDVINTTGKRRGCLALCRA